MKTSKRSPMTISLSSVAMILTSIFVFANLLGEATSFSWHHGVLTSARISSLHMKAGSDFLSKLNPFSGEDSTDGRSTDSFSSSGDDGSGSQDLAADVLIAKAKAVIAADLAIQDPSLLDENFVWIGPFLDKPLGKLDYLASGRFFNLRTAFPDLDYRAHDFRLDANDPLTVRCTVRPQGVMRGPLRLRNEVVQPNGNRLIGPPEAISLTFDPKSGKVVKLCSGFALDRLVGNTYGLCGAMAAAAIAGVPPSDWEVYPIPTVISRFFGRPVDPVEEVSTFLAPFPETVMIQLAKGVLATNLAADDPSLLAKDFSFITPTVGPIGRNSFLESYATQEFGDFEPELSNFRVDPFDPYRVWVDVKLVGPGLEGPPQAFSFTIDDNGFCTRLTAGAVMDPSIGNTGGLTGLAGIKYALGAADLDFTVRPFKVALGRLKKTILSPFTKLSPDDYLQQSSVKSRQSTKGLPDEAPQGQETEEEGTSKSQLQVEPESMLTLSKDEEEGRERQSRNDPELKEEFPSLKSFSEFTSSWPTKIPSDLKLPSPPTIMPEVKLPSPPKIPPELKLPSPPKVPPSPPLLQRPTLPKMVPTNTNPAISKEGVTGSFFADAFKAFSQADASRKRQPTETDQARVDTDKKIKLEEEQRRRDQERKKAEAARKTELERKKAAEAQAKRDEEVKSVLKKQEEEQRKLDLERKKAEVDRKAELEMKKTIAAEAQAKRDAEAKSRMKARDEEQRKRDLERKKAEEDRKAEVERKRAITAEAQAKRDEEAKSAMKKREEEQQRKRDQERKEAENRRQTELKRTKDAEAKDALERRKKEAEATRLNAERKRKEASSPLPNAKVPSSGRPSFQIPSFGDSGSQPAQKPFSSTPSPQKARPSFQIALLGRPSVANPAKNAEDKSTPGPPMARPTFQLPKFSSGSEEKPTPSRMTGRPSVPIPTAVKPPNGVPIIAAWQKRPNGVVSGQIFRSPNFKDGERIETSPIAIGDFANGSVVITASGSKYFLSGQTPRELLAASTPRPGAPPVAKPPPRPSLKIQPPPKAPANKIPTKTPRKSLPETAKRPTFSLSALMGGSNEMTPKGTAQQSGTRSVPKAAPKPTPQKTSAIQQPARVLPKKTAPKGVPTISRWKQNRDKTITGVITGSPAFEEGERITTSPITGGMVTTGEVIVTTTSGSRYFLSRTMIRAEVSNPCLIGSGAQDADKVSRERNEKLLSATYSGFAINIFWVEAGAREDDEFLAKSASSEYVQLSTDI